MSKKNKKQKPKEKEQTDQTTEQVTENTDNQTTENANSGEPSTEEVEITKEEDFETKYNNLNDKYLRLTAEFDNYRKRTLKEKMDLIKGGGSDVLKNILPIVDNFERAMKASEEADDIEALRGGIVLIYNSFKEFLKQRGVKEIEALNSTLDTDLHEAVAQMPATDEEQKGKIIDVIEKGYKLDEKVLRFAKVVVAQ